MRIFLSKSQFLRGLQCKKALWLLKNKPGEAAPPDAQRLEIFRTGEEVGRLARGLFPGGVEVRYRKNLDHMVSETERFILGGEAVIYEASFRFDDVLVMVDILRKGERGWGIYEVKSSTSVKDVHVDDLAIQSYVLRGTGLALSGAYLVTINNRYVRRGDIDVLGLFNVNDLTFDAGTKVRGVAKKLSEMREALEGPCPGVDIGPWCTDPYECDFIPLCWAHIPQKSVFDLRGRGVDKFAFYSEGKISFKDLVNDELNQAQRMQVEAELGGVVTMDRGAIKGFLKKIRYPLYFLDFETFSDAVPPFDGTSPYEQIPFQYSVHSIESEGAPLRHDEFLAREGVDERRELARALTAAIPPDACVIAYNMSFERRVLKKLAEDFPLYREGLIAISENLLDLMVPFKKRYYYTREMEGSFSLKKVLPALLDGLDYSGLEIKDGAEASIAYKRLVEMEERKKAAVKKDLLEYCRMDTLALVRLLEKLKGLVR
ncbi:MAG: DUF2779 domain-containing protein [Thermodesulfobacteriota bacterium]|nr:MAG: DUF2779 domain-containing protein [Thermodesulfobacteriota bacterium]